MASVVDICNRALQKVGVKTITSLTEDSVTARACNACYESLRDSELEDHAWGFAIDRESLAADSAAPAFGRARSFQLPSNLIRVLPPYPEDNLSDLDWLIEGGKIYTDDSDPLYIRFVKRITDPQAMTPLFREALSCRMAVELCETLANFSAVKKGSLKSDYEYVISRARRSNAIQKASVVNPDDTWLTSRA